MIVAATTDCFPDLPLPVVFERMTDLEYSAVEIVMRPDSPQLTARQVLENPEQVLALCRSTHRMDIVGYSVEIDATGPEHYEQFHACCKLAKATKVATITVPSAELGTPFNEEVEHLRRLVAVATMESVVVSLKTQIGRLSEDPDTVKVLCNNVKNLRVTLDPSHYLCEPNAGRSYDKLLEHTQHVQLRDTSKTDLHVRVGQGEIDFGRLVNVLRRHRYDRALSVDMPPLPEVEHRGEMRKLRLLLESLL